MKRQVSVSVVFPAFNEEENLERVVNDARNFLAETVADYRIVVVNDGSTDRTADVAQLLSRAGPGAHAGRYP